MKKNLFRITLGALALAVTAGAQAQVTAEDMVKFRQSGYTFMNWNMGKIKAMAVDGAQPYNQEQIVAAANVIAAIANSGMGALYSPDTLNATGWKPTRLKANFFEEPEKVREVAVNFIQQANKMQEVAVNGDQQAVAAQFNQLVESCRGCHQNFRGD
ncbi:c-type cytochrome [Azoarcus taiwanensis]|uniref:Cytochrome c n=1 Tax=Azoarcus taiwanensis TaxID=666964 RepID=A0A972JA98_9RHOO|nr:cytochrome c [Azoarcus taiwanensis]NMG03775.1 cytochrome c [Azoarcus taiwanensis]